MSQPERSVLVGTVGKPHGLDGSVHVREPMSNLLLEGRVVTVNSTARKIVRRAGTDAHPILRFEGCSSREDAEAIRGATLSVNREELPPLGDQEWWVEDLVGCQVRDGDQIVGQVSGVVGLPSCEVLQVARDPLPELLVPIVSDAIRSVNLEQALIEVDLEFLGEERS